MKAFIWVVTIYCVVEVLYAALNLARRYVPENTPAVQAVGLVISLAVALAGIHLLAA